MKEAVEFIVGVRRLDPTSCVTLGGSLTCLSFNSLYCKEGALAFRGLDGDLTESLEGLGTQ